VQEKPLALHSRRRRHSRTHRFVLVVAPGCRMIASLMLALPRGQAVRGKQAKEQHQMMSHLQTTATVVQQGAQQQRQAVWGKQLVRVQE
jgi:hypothetical protein